MYLGSRVGVSPTILNSFEGTLGLREDRGRGSWGRIVGEGVFCPYKQKAGCPSAFVNGTWQVSSLLLNVKCGINVATKWIQRTRHIKDVLRDTEKDYCYIHLQSKRKLVTYEHKSYRDAKHNKK